MPCNVNGLNFVAGHILAPCIVLWSAVHVFPKLCKVIRNVLNVAVGFRRSRQDPIFDYPPDLFGIRGWAGPVVRAIPEKLKTRISCENPLYPEGVATELID